VEWGSGGITSIGDGVSNAGDVALSGSLAYLETGATNSNSALKSLTTIASNGELQLENGASATTTGALTVAGGGELYVDSGGSGGSSLTLGGSLTNSGTMQVGNYYMTTPSTVKVTGTYTGTGATTLVDAGNTAGANALLKISGAAPGILTGTYRVDAYAGSAAVEWGSGGITSIGNGSTEAGDVTLDRGRRLYGSGRHQQQQRAEELTTIASNGELQMQDGASVTTTGALTVASGGYLYVDNGGSGGSSLTLGGSLTNSGTMQVGNYYMTSPSTVKVTGTYRHGRHRAGGCGQYDRRQCAAQYHRRGARNLDGHLRSRRVRRIGGGGMGFGRDHQHRQWLRQCGRRNSVGWSLAYLETGATNSNSALKS
jgi:fibronectin-binding autotransporter adhesin